ncbi:uncharacterized protein PSFLO_04260 [Pseudozyma flocculosa]|uniref:Uncharacterized protein n=1 Tax=Pseudozyma flocculosa TaxID=84751 RepID=A0A5C3F6B2_9BASI|nr:uncharacterized protein PSFLO_04260 [Pseudozyma flocculosa]
MYAKSTLVLFAMAAVVALTSLPGAQAVLYTHTASGTTCEPADDAKFSNSIPYPCRGFHEIGCAQLDSRGFCVACRIAGSVCSDEE